MRLSPSILCLAAVVLGTWSPAAVAAPRSISVVLLAPDGAKAVPMEATDANISLNRSTDPAMTDLSSQVSLSMDTAALGNRALLDWLKQNGTGVLITVDSRGTPTMTYELRDITTRSVNLSHSSSSDGQLSLSIGAGTLVVNGVSVK